MLNKYKNIEKNVNNFWIILGLSVVIGVGMPTHEAQALSIRPLKKEVVIEQGTDTKETITLHNESGFVEVITLSTRAFSSSDTEGVPAFINEIQPYEKWFAIPQKEIILQPGQTKDIQFSITTPLHAEPGGYYVAVFATSQPKNKDATVAYKNEIGVLYFLVVPGNISRKLSTKEVEVNISSYGRTQVSATYELENKGNIHEQPRGTLYIKNIFSSEEITEEINKDGLILLPLTQRTLSQNITLNANWHSPLNPFRFGIYELTLTINENDTHTSRSIVWSPAGIIIMAVVSGWFIFYRRKKRSI